MKRRITRWPLFLRQISGKSMQPALREGQVVAALAWFWRLRPGDVVIIEHNGMEKIKRLKKIRQGEVWLAGDNPGKSTDSRHFGWLPREAVLAKVVYPNPALSSEYSRRGRQPKQS